MKLKAGKERAPFRVPREHLVQFVGFETMILALSRMAARLQLRGIPVVNCRIGGYAGKPCHLFKRCQLVVGECLCRVQVQRTGSGIGLQLVKNRQVECQRFTAGCWCCDDNIPACTDMINGPALVRVQPDIFIFKICFQGGRERGFELAVPGFLRRDCIDMNNTVPVGRVDLRRRSRSATAIMVLQEVEKQPGK